MPSNDTIPDRRVVPRFVVPPTQLFLTEFGHAVSVNDLSEGGAAIRLVDRSQLALFSVGRQFHGELKLFQYKYPVELQVRYLRGLTVGCSWTNISEELKHALKKLFNAEEMARQLKLIPLPEQENILWYHAPIGVDGLIYKNASDNALYRWVLYWHGSVVQWDNENHIRTGRTLAENDESATASYIRLETRFLEWDEGLDASLLKIAEELIQHSSIEEKFRSRILAQLQGG